MKTTLQAFVLVLATFGAGHSGAAEAEAIAAVPEEDLPEPLPAPKNGWQSVLDTNRWRGVTFRRSYGSLVEALSEAHGPEQFSQRLDFAEFLIAYMFLPEAQSILDESAKGDEPVPMRLRAMREAVTLLNGRAPETMELSPLFVPQRQDRDLWITLHALATNDSEALEAHLPHAFRALGMQSRAVAQTVFPVFVEAAIALENKELATAVIPFIDKVPHLTGTPYGQYLYGRYSELMGNNKTALDAYLAASAGWDRAAARARLAMADMALADGGQGALLAARDTLADSSDAWRGDQYELQVLLRQAEILTRLGEPVDGLLAFGKVMSRFPQTPEAERAMPQARDLLDQVYATGANGEIAIAKWMDIHLMLLPFFENQPAFAYYNEQLADRAYALGGTVLAAAEYQRTLRTLEDLAYFEPDNMSYADSIARVYVKRIAALRDSGRHEEALVELKNAETRLLKAGNGQLTSLKADVLAAIGDHDALLAMSLSTPNLMQMRAQVKALVEAERWGEAGATLQKMRRAHPHGFNVHDASYLLIAAHKTSDAETVAEVGRDFPSLTSSQGWVEVAQSMSQAPIKAMPLMEDKADAQLDRLQDVLLSLKDSGL